MKPKDYKIYHSQNIYEERSYVAGKEAGRREAWDYIYANVHLEFDRGKYPAFVAKLKEWGIGVK